MTGTRVNAEGSNEKVQVSWQAVSPDYFRVMTIPIYKGTTFADGDMSGAVISAIVNRPLAERLWRDRDPLGQRLVMSGGATPLTVIGVAGETRDGSLDVPGHPVVYVPVYPGAGTVVMFGSADPLSLVPAVRRALMEVDPLVAPSDVRLMDERVSRSYALQRFTALLLGVFAAVAAFLGAVGLYGVVSFAVGRRTREIGIRRALGAQRLGIAGLVIGQAFRLVGAGLVIGVTAAYGLTRLLASLLFEVSPTDVSTFVIVSIAMIVVALVACYVPARRALRLDPASALREG